MLALPETKSIRVGLHTPGRAVQEQGPRLSDEGLMALPIPPMGELQQDWSWDAFMWVVNCSDADSHAMIKGQDSTAHLIWMLERTPCSPLVGIKEENAYYWKTLALRVNITSFQADIKFRNSNKMFIMLHSCSSVATYYIYCLNSKIIFDSMNEISLALYGRFLDYFMVLKDREGRFISSDSQVCPCR